MQAADSPAKTRVLLITGDDVSAHDWLTCAVATREVLQASGYGARMGFGKRPALMIVDVSYNFVGEEPAPILESIKR
jgi:hypothetical protein